MSSKSFASFGDSSERRCAHSFFDHPGRYPKSFVCSRLHSSQNLSQFCDCFDECFCFAKRFSDPYGLPNKEREDTDVSSLSLVTHPRFELGTPCLKGIYFSVIHHTFNCFDNNADNNRKFFVYSYGLSLLLGHLSFQM